MAVIKQGEQGRDKIQRGFLWQKKWNIKHMCNGSKSLQNLVVGTRCRGAFS